MWGRRPGRYAHHHVPRKRNLRRKLLSQNDLFLRFADRLPRLPGGRRPLVTRSARPGDRRRPDYTAGLHGQDYRPGLPARAEPARLSRLETG